MARTASLRSAASATVPASSSFAPTSLSSSLSRTATTVQPLDSPTATRTGVQTRSFGSSVIPHAVRDYASAFLHGSEELKEEARVQHSRAVGRDVSRLLLLPRHSPIGSCRASTVAEPRLVPINGTSTRGPLRGLQECSVLHSHKR